MGETKKDMQPINIAAAEVRRLANVHRAMLETADLLDSVTSISNHVDELKAKRDNLLNEAGQIAANIRSEKEIATAEQDAATKKLADLRAQAEGIIRAAEDRAHSILSEAEGLAKNAYYDGTKKERDEREAIKRSSISLRSSLKRIESDIEEKSHKLYALEANLAEVEEKRDKIKKELGNLLNG